MSVVVKLGLESVNPSSVQGTLYVMIDVNDFYDMEDLKKEGSLNKEVILKCRGSHTTEVRYRNDSIVVAFMTIMEYECIIKLNQNVSYNFFNEVLSYQPKSLNFPHIYFENEDVWSLIIRRVPHLASVNKGFCKMTHMFWRNLEMPHHKCSWYKNKLLTWGVSSWRVYFDDERSVILGYMGKEMHIICHDNKVDWVKVDKVDDDYNFNEIIIDSQASFKDLIENIAHVKIPNYTLTYNNSVSDYCISSQLSENEDDDFELMM